MYKKFLAFVMALVTLTSLGFLNACKRGVEAVNKNMTQLYIGNYNGGVGQVWIVEAANAFAEKYKDYSFEKGKKGVQFFFDHDKDLETETNILGSKNLNELYFNQGVNYTEWADKGLLLDITQWVNEDLTEFGENESIMDKVNAPFDTFLNRNGKIYGVPFWEAYYGIQYNISMFENNGYYFDEDNVLGAGKNDAKSVGLDGIAGTADDGLPTTYAEFFELCDYIADGGKDPIIWSGKAKDYFSWLLSSLMADYEGTDKFMVNYTLNGTVDVIDSFNGNTPVIKQVSINDAANNGALLAKQPGLYYALSFAEQLLRNPDRYADEGLYPTATNLDVQISFVQGESPMIIEGTWWENEATSALQKEFGSEGKMAQDCKFGVMPLPKVNQEEVEKCRSVEQGGEGKGTTLVSPLSSYVYVKSNVAESKYELIKKFIQFCHTDERMKIFTETTGMYKPYEYETDQNSNISYYDKQLKALVENVNTTVIVPISKHPYYLKDYTNFYLLPHLFMTSVKIEGKTWVDWNSLEVFGQSNNSLTAKDYFEGVYQSRTSRFSAY